MLRFQKGQQEAAEISLQTYPGSRGKVTGCPENIDIYKFGSGSGMHTNLFLAGYAFEFMPHTLFFDITSSLDKVSWRRSQS